MARPGAGLLLLVVSSSALAAPPDDDAAGRLVDEGIELVRAGNAEAGCARFDTALRLQVTVRTQGLAAGCHEQVGRLASAWHGYARLRALAEQAGDADSAAFAAAGQARLEPRLARIIVHVPRAVAADPDLLVVVDGQPWPRGHWNAAVPIDAGDHDLRAELPGRQPFAARFVAVDGWQVRQVVELGASVAPRLPPPAASGPSGVRRTAGMAGVAAGGTLLVVGAAFGYGAHRAWDDARAAGCTGDGRCPDARSLARLQQAGARADAASWLLGSGAIVAAAGALFWLTGPDPGPSGERPPRMTLTGNGGGAQLSITGTF